MSSGSPPLPPAALRQTSAAPLDDEEFRAAAVADVTWLQERCGLDPDMAVMEVGCGAGLLAVGLRLHLGSVRHFTGLDGDATAIGWCTKHLEGPSLEFVLQDIDFDTTGRITLEHDRMYDLILVRWSWTDTPHAALGEMLRSLRHHVTDHGTIVLDSAGDAASSAEFVGLAQRAGLVVGIPSEPGAVGRRGVTLSPGLDDDGERPFAHVVEAAWQRRTIAGLEARLESLSAEYRAFSADAGRQRAALAARAAERERVVDDLRTRLKQMRSKHRRQQRRIEQLEVELADARQKLTRRLVRAVTRGASLPGESAAAPQDDDARTPSAAVNHTEPLVSDRSANEAPPRRLGARPAATVDPTDVVIYTAIVGDHDHLPDVSRYAVAPARFVCFSDVVPTDPLGWEILPIAYHDVDPKRVALFYKTHPHLLFPDRGTSVWVDASFTWNRSPFEIFGELGGWSCDMAALARLAGVTLVTAADEIVARGLDSAPLVEAQLERVRRAGYPVDDELHDTSILVRRHRVDTIVGLDEAWWAEIERGSRRDRLSFDVAAWTVGADIGTLAPYPTGRSEIDGVTIAPHRVEARYRRPRATAAAARRRSSWSLQHRHPRSTVSHDREPIDVVVPVHDALPDVQRCARSVLDDPAFHGRLVLVDDGSHDVTRRWCDALARQHEKVVVVRHDESLGFAAACNSGIAQVSTDVFVLLNSDTVVPSSWSRKLADRLRSHEGIGLIGPLSNAASWQSIPTIRDPDGDLAVNGLPPRCSLDDVNDFLELLCADVVTPLVGTLNGFCMMIRREVVETAGVLDAEAFPVGYGEEVDLCLRATDSGFLCAVAPDTYVYHSKSRSFGSARRPDLKTSGQAVLRERYGVERLARVAVSTRSHPVLEFVRSAFDELYAPHPTAMDNVARRAPI